MFEKLDPRAVRTQEMLKSALFNLLQSGIPMHQITVQRLTKEAHLNRTTFYLHYQDIDELRKQLVDDILHMLTLKFEKLSEVLLHDRTDQLLQVLQYLQIQRESIVVLAQFEQLEQHLFELMKRLIITRRHYSKSPSKRAAVHPDIKTASLVGIIMWWLKNGQHLPAKEIAEQIQFMYRKS